MAWKNYKRESHRRRIAKRYMTEWFTYRNTVSIHEVFDYSDKQKSDYVYEYKYYSSYHKKTFSHRAVDFHKAWGELSQEEVWEVERRNYKTQETAAKKLTDGAYDKYRRLSKLRVGKAWFDVHAEYDRHVRYIGKFGTEEEIDNLTPTGDVFTRFGWWY